MLVKKAHGCGVELSRFQVSGRPFSDLQTEEHQGVCCGLSFQNVYRGVTPASYGLSGVFRPHIPAPL